MLYLTCTNSPTFGITVSFFLFFLMASFMYQELAKHEVMNLNKNEALKKHLLKSMMSVSLLGEAPFSCEFYLLPSRSPAFQLERIPGEPKRRKKAGSEDKLSQNPLSKISRKKKMMGEEENLLCTYLLIYFIIFCPLPQRSNLLTENTAVFLERRHERKKENQLCRMIK